MIITCIVPANTAKEEFAPFPGSDAALDEGCVCPEKQKLWPQKLQFSTDCPIHQLEQTSS